MLICLKFALNNAFEAMESRTRKRTHKLSYEKCFEIFLIEMSNLRGLTGENQVKGLERREYIL